MEPVADDRQSHFQQIRTRAVSEMAEIGVDAEFIPVLVDTFYDRVRNHPQLGPVFEARLAGQWPEHLAKMKRFWSAVAFKDGGYQGKPVMAHQGIANLEAPLFKVWLGLFSETLDDIAPSAEAKDWFMATAERIAKSLVLSLFYNPADDDPARGSA
ncbi:truncated hemoglobin [Rhizobium sp. TRM96647]|uniref:group III truncated hemoglobin n=1 Tax=unclassified Rhizobium TaxID=2613769 RepID=UPI0021E82B53|nr:MULTISPECIES: truncated hemoglobin [unclassified Rhizobium]MCV3736282.1 truncated hemoglobin [Rhizobium sp. TRM96647]MCV3758651.1 truncated hemoglobin [Rhizobium sp. TRM96650]